MTFQFTASPHRSLQSVPTPGITPPQDSSIRVTFSVTKDELFSLAGSLAHFLPEPQDGFPIPGNSPYRRQPDEAAALLRWLSQEAQFSISLRFLKNINGRDDWYAEGQVLGLYTSAPPGSDGAITMLPFQVRQNRELNFTGFSRTNDSERYLSTDIAGNLRARIYRFSAERFNVGRSQFGNNPILASNAQNLPEVLDTLQANPARFSQLNQMVHEILPQVRQVSVRPVVNQQVEVIVWPHDPASQREDLAIPLNDCGSGVGQVLAILYVVMTSDHPQIILIDEPQSFLHPGAVRKLIEVLKRHPQHQYILSTHSPIVITSAEPATMTIARVTDGETSLQAVNPRNAQDLQAYLLEIGVRLSDLFGADNVLWVEGQTEVTCFPLILKNILKRSLMGTVVVGIRQTGDLTGRDKKKILDIYQRLCGANTLLPPAIAFVLDKECLTNSQANDVLRAGRGLVHFLPRRMYENYLLNPRAIAGIANEIEGFRPAQVGEDEVKRLLDEKRVDLHCFCPGIERVPDDWIVHVDGTRVLEEIFGQLSEHRVSYDKMRHSVAITDWLLRQQPDDFRELAAWLAGLLAATD